MNTDPTHLFAERFVHENHFHLTCEPGRVSKIMAHHELFRRTVDVPGAIVECGVFKGASFAGLAGMRSVLGVEHKALIGFDTFDLFPETSFDADQEKRRAFIEEAGSQSISKRDLEAFLRLKGCGGNVDLIAGDICETVPRYVNEHPDLKISLLNLDTDIYEPAKVILEQFYPIMSSGGIIMLDDYGVFPGETEAVDEYFADKHIDIHHLSYRATPAFILVP
jgi:hypothetical protein